MIKNIYNYELEINTKKVFYFAWAYQNELMKKSTRIRKVRIKEENETSNLHPRLREAEYETLRPNTWA